MAIAGSRASSGVTSSRPNEPVWTLVDDCTDVPVFLSLQCPGRDITPVSGINDVIRGAAIFYPHQPRESPLGPNLG